MPALVAGLAFNFSTALAALGVALGGNLGTGFALVLPTGFWVAGGAAFLATVFLATGFLATGFAGFFAAGLAAVFLSGRALALTTGFFTGLTFFAGAFTTYLLAKPAAPGNCAAGMLC